MRRWKLPRSTFHQSKQPCSSKVQLLQEWFKVEAAAEMRSKVAEMSSLKMKHRRIRIEVSKFRICRRAAQLDDDHTKSIHTEK